MPETHVSQSRGRGPGKTRRVLLVGFWWDELLLDSIVEEAGARDWQVMALRFFEGEKSIRDWHPDGVLTCGVPGDADWDQIRGFGCPVVRSGLGWPPGAGGVGHVTEDSEKVGEMAAAHFLERGFRHVGFVLGEPDQWVGSREDATYKGLQRQVERAGGTCLPPHFFPNWDHGETTTLWRRGTEWLASIPRPVGILVWRDVFAGHVCAMCRQNGVSVPEEVAVLGIGNRRRFCKISPCQLSSVDTDSAQHGRESVQLLQRMMDGEAPPAEVVWVPPVGVVQRKSTDILAVADVGVARALTFIWEHLSEPLSVDDVAAGADVPRRTLCRHFQAQVGRTIGQELLRKRLERCRDLLLKTDLTVTDIAPMLGLLSKNYLHRAFRKKFGVSPKEFRQQRRGGG
jgi:LacI family transcriptional regulator